MNLSMNIILIRGKNKMEEKRKLSASQINLYLSNRMGYLARYIYKRRDDSPSFYATRGKVLESAIIDYSMNPDLKNNPDFTFQEYLESDYNIQSVNQIADYLDAPYIDLTINPEKSYSIPELYQYGIDKYPERESEINKMFEEYNKAKKELLNFSFDTIELLLKQIDISKFEFQKHFTADYKENISIQGYLDFYSSEVCYDLKTANSKRELKESEKIQLGIYYMLTGIPQKIILLYPIGDEAEKINSIHRLANQGKGIDEIYAQYRSPEGKKTTKAYIEKIITNGIQPESGLIIYEPTPDELLEYSNFAQNAIESIIFMDKVCKSELDYKLYLFGTLADKYMDEEEKKFILGEYNLKI